MKKITVLMILTIGFAQDFTVDGDLNVSGNKVLNVADPTAETDAVNLRSLNEAGGMKVERIYTFTQEGDYDGPNTYSEFATVPADKVWYVIAMGGYDGFYININGANVYIAGSSYSTGGNEFWALPNSLLSKRDDGAYHISILEYSFTSSGTSQGMNYIEP